MSTEARVLSTRSKRVILLLVTTLLVIGGSGSATAQSPVVTLISPADAATTTNDYMDLSASVTDSDPTTAWIYGGTSSPPTDLLYVEENITGTSTLNYSWNALPLGTGVNTMGLWHFNEGTGTTAADATTNSNDGTLNGDATWTADGKFGYALDLDGAGDYFTVPDASSLDIDSATGALTIEMWVYPRTMTAAFHTLLGKFASTSAINYQISVDATNRLVFYSGKFTLGGIWYSDFVLPVGEWSYVAVTLDAADGTVHFYRNGVAGTPQTGAYFGLPNSGSLYIGTNGVGEYINGRIDDVRLTNSVLSASEIAANYGLDVDTYYWRTDADDGISAPTQSAVRSFDVETFVPEFDPPVITLNVPADGAATANNFMLLSSTVNDASPPMTVKVFGDETGDPSTLLYVEEGVADGAAVSFDWNASVLQVDATYSMGLWHFDENTGTSTADATANVNDAAFVGAPAWTADGRFGYALDFNGTSDYVVAPDDPSLDVDASTGALTVELWVYPHSSGGGTYRSILAKRSFPGTVTNYQISLDGSTGNLLFYDGMNIDVSAVSVPLNQWSYLAVSLDAAEGLIRFYRNGVKLDSLAGGFGAANSEDLYIGVAGQVGECFDGLIDEVRLTNRLLTTSEIAANYELGDGTHNWKVVATDAQDNTGSAGPRAFTVDTTPPDVPTLESPTDELLTNDNTPTFDWSSEVGAVSYTLQYATDAGFTTGLVTVSDLATNTHTVVGALSDATYYWHVKAIDVALNESAYQTTPFSFTVDATAPAVPTLVNPADLAVISDNTPTFDWSSEVGAVSYTLQYATDAGFTTGLVTVSGLTTNTHTVVGALSDATYYWHVKAIDVALNESAYQTTPFSFTVDATAPAVPTLVNPADLAVISDNTPTFDWSSEVGAVSYTLQYATDAGFTTGLVTVSGLTTNTHTVVGALSDATYYWHVKAIDVALNESAYQTTPFSFTVDATAPAVPTLVNPADLAVISDNTPTFDWSSEVGAVSYTLQYATDAGFTTGLVTVSDLATNTHTVVGALSDATYYWHVKAIDVALNESAYQTTPFSFTVDATAPAVPTLVNPADLAVISDNTPTFDWSSEVGAVSYTLQYATDAGFTTGLVTVSGLTTNTHTVVGALSDATYYWHVKAIDVALNESAYQTTPFSFTVDATAPAVPTLVNPADLAVISDNTPTFDWSATAEPGGSFTLQVATDAGFTTGLQTFTGITATTFTTALLDGTYYWHVKAIDAATNESGYSAPFSFTITPGADADPPVITLLAPADAASFSADPVSLSASVSDVSPPMTVWIYGDATATPAGLLYVEEGVADLATVGFDWSASVLQPESPYTMGLWHIDENTGTAVADASGNGNGGTFIGAPAWTAAGRFGYALDFNGTSDYIAIPEDPSLDIDATTGAVTMEVWVNPRSSGGGTYRSIMAKRGFGSGAGPCNYQISLNNSNGNLLFYNGSTIYVSTVSVPLDEWSYLAVTLSAAEGRLRFYRNGALLDSSITAATFGPANDSGFYIGVANLVGECFDGLIDEARVTNRALTSAEIAANYNLETGTYYWRVEAEDNLANAGATATRSFDISASPPETDPPVITLNAPADAATTSNPFMTLDASFADASPPMKIWIYGDDQADPTTLLEVRDDVADLGNVTFDWSASVFQPESPYTMGLWHFDEGAGASAADAGANGNSGALAGGAVWTTGGRFGHALDLNGTSGYVNVPDAPSLDIDPTTGAITMEMWLYPRSIPAATQYRTLIGKWASGSSINYQISVDDQNRLLYYRGSWPTIWVSDIVLPLSEWSYVAVTLDATDSTLHFYRNGVEGALAVGPRVDSASFGPINAAPITIGQNGATGGAEFFDGLVDEVRITNRALSTAEIEANYRLNDGVYYWKVTATDQEDNTATAGPRSFTVNTAGPPGVPTLISPADLAVTSDDTPTFEWSATAGPGDTYTLEYATDAGFITDLVTVSGIAGETYTPVAALLADTYYWHVQAKGAGGDSSGYQTTPFSFTVDTEAPDVPTLLSPADLALINDDTPTFEWSATAGGGTYTLQYAMDAGFTTGLVTVTDIAATTHTPPGALADATYYWHVQALDEATNESGYQPIPFSFTIDTTPPDVPTLINPADLAVINDDTPTFDWSATAGTGGTYALEYATDVSFTIGLVAVPGLTVATYTAPTALPDDVYYWRVKAIDAATNESGYQTTPFSFTLSVGADLDPPLITLDFPADGEVTLNSFMLLSTTVSDASPPMTVWIYGDDQADPTTLLHVESNVADLGTVTFDWDASVLQPESPYTMGLWHFDENTGTTVADASGNGNGGTLVGPPSWTEGGRFGYALDFNGTTDYVTVPHAASLDVDSATGALTMEAWVYPRAAGGDNVWRTIASKSNMGNASQVNYRMSLDRTTGNLLFYSGRWPEIWISSVNVPENEWSYVALSLDAVEGKLRFYRNGVVLDSTAAGSAWFGPAFTSTLNIGVSFSLVEPFDGLIDEVRLTNRVLSTAEIAANYQLSDGVYYWKVTASDSFDNTGSAGPRSFTIGLMPPEVPTLLLPPDLAVLSDDTPTFDWSATAGMGGTYTLQYATNVGFTADLITVPGLGDTTYTVGGALADNTYYWRVQAKNSGGDSSGYQTPFSFTLDTQVPEAPVLISPVDLALISLDTPTLDWSGTAGAGGTYTLQYALDAGLTTGLVTVAGLAETTYTVPPLMGGQGLPDNTYYWRVQAKDSGGDSSGYQTPFSFTVDTEAPLPPTLINPLNLAVITDNTPTFDWSETAGAGGSYTLQYGNDPGFTFAVTVSGLTAPSFTVSTALVDDAYYWHVRATDAAGNASGYQASPFSFTVSTAVAQVPILVEPLDQSFTCDTTPTFVWTNPPPVVSREPATGAESAMLLARQTIASYSLQYSTDPTFATMTTVGVVAETTYTVPDTAALDDTTYYWRVEAIDEGGGHSGYQPDAFEFGIFVAGDVNNDGVVTSADIIYLVNYVFKGGQSPLPCAAAGDVNCDEVVTSGDIIYLVNYVFKGGDPPCNVGDLIAAFRWSCP